MIDLKALVTKAAVASLNAQAEAAQKATRKLTPRGETGDLIESIKVTKATQRGLVSQVYSNSDYALFQHENLNLRHDDGQSKFMEAAVIGGKAKIADAGADAARAAFG